MKELSSTVNWDKCPVLNHPLWAVNHPLSLSVEGSEGSSSLVSSVSEVGLDEDGELESQSKAAVFEADEARWEKVAVVAVCKLLSFVCEASSW